jgi:hypothetical protein
MASLKTKFVSSIFFNLLEYSVAPELCETIRLQTLNWRNEAPPVAQGEVCVALRLFVSKTWIVQ